MVGAAQYQDIEIEWVLSAVVTKKKQSYIQEHFKERFGRELNHNQIRYIKNKYGKDPRFNSPLVNIHAPPRVTTPEPEFSNEHGNVVTQGNDAGFENQNQAGSLMATKEAQNGPDDNGSKATHPKRKRSRHEQGDALGRLSKQTATSHRLSFNPQSSAASGPIFLSQQQNTSDVRLPTSHIHTHPPSMPQATLGDGDHTPLLAEMFQGLQHSQTFPLLHSTHANITWAPSMFMDNRNWEAARNTAMMEEHQLMGCMMFQSQTPAQHQIRQPSSQLVDQQVSQFSPAIPSLGSPPYAEHQEQHQQLLQQEQQLYSHADVGKISTLLGSGISNLENAPHMQNLSGVAPQIIPSFQEVPIESTRHQHCTTHLTPAELESGTDWAHNTPLNSSPQDLSLFNFTTSPMGFPFESVSQTGLTAATSEAIRQTLYNNANLYHSSLPTQGQHHHHSPQSGQQLLNFDASAFEFLDMAQTPTMNATAIMPHAQRSYPVNNSTMNFSPSIVQARNRRHISHRRSTPLCPVHSTTSDVSGTIDPRLLATNSASPQPRTPMSSPLDEAKRAMETPTKNLLY